MNGFLQGNGIPALDRLDRFDMPVHLITLVKMGNRLAHERSHPEPDGLDQSSRLLRAVCERTLVPELR